MMNTLLSPVIAYVLTQAALGNDWDEAEPYDQMTQKDFLREVAAMVKEEIYA